MTKLTRHLFNGFDDRLLSYLSEEGQQIEPEWYVCIQGIICLCYDNIAALFTKVLEMLQCWPCCTEVNRQPVVLHGLSHPEGKKAQQMLHDYNLLLIKQHVAEAAGAGRANRDESHFWPAHTHLDAGTCQSCH